LFTLEKWGIMTENAIRGTEWRIKLTINALTAVLATVNVR
jgi:hypothetical protein